MGELNAMGMEKAAARTSVEIHTALSLRIMFEKKSTVHLEAPTFLKELLD